VSWSRLMPSVRSSQRAHCTRQHLPGPRADSRSSGLELMLEQEDITGHTLTVCVQ
jgi:hypothetical protein